MNRHVTTSSAAAAMFCASLAMLGGCVVGNTTHIHGEPGSARVAGKPSDQAQAAFDRIKGLAGEWQTQMPGSDGQPGPAAISTFEVTSNGSAVREVMFKGAEHEMTNLYHLDGSSIVVTHYCAMGNQPRMRATNFGSRDIAFAFDGVSNLRDANQGYMGELTLQMDSPTALTQRWRHFGGKEAAEPTIITYTRKQ